MHELDPAHYEAVLPLVARNRIDGYSSFAFAVLEGRQPGRVFVDEAEAPQSALVVHSAQPSLLCGKADKSSGLALQHIVRRLPQGKPPVLWTASDDWHRVLAALPVTPLRRTVFLDRPTSAPEIEESLLPDGFQVKQIDKALLEVLGPAFTSESLSSWGGPAGFVQNSFGFCALRGREIGSVCAAAFIGGGSAEVDISTEDKFQRQGLAAATGRAFLRYCLLHSLRPDWSCRSSNIASAALAAKLGFGKPQEISGCLLHGLPVEA